MLLTSSDLALASLVGLPIGIRLTFEKQLRKNKHLTFFTEDVGFLVFEYLYILRVMIVAVISAEKCFHIVLPFKYIMIVTERRIKMACAMIVLIPLLRVAPVIHVLLKHDGVIVHCTYYNDGIGSRSAEIFYTPLTCLIDVPSDKLPGFDIADTVGMATLVGISWLIILVSNIFIMVVVFDKAFRGYLTRQNRLEVNLKIMKNSILVLLIASCFAFTNFPFAYAWTSHVMTTEKNYKQHYYLILLTFFSLLFHPWFYCFRLRNIRNLFNRVKGRIHHLTVTSVSHRASATSTVIMNTMNRANSRV
jgi:hypothetical protein